MLNFSELQPKLLNIFILYYFILLHIILLFLEGSEDLNNS